MEVKLGFHYVCTCMSQGGRLLGKQVAKKTASSLFFLDHAHLFLVVSFAFWVKLSVTLMNASITPNVLLLLLLLFTLLSHSIYLLRLLFSLTYSQKLLKNVIK